MDRTDRFYERLKAAGVADTEGAMLRLLKTADAHDDALAATVTLFDRIAATLKTFYLAPLTISAVQPILALAVELNPELEPKVTEPNQPTMTDAQQRKAHRDMTNVSPHSPTCLCDACYRTITNQFQAAKRDPRRS